MDLQTLMAFITYFSILLTIGIISYFKTKNESDFVLGSRSLNYWVTAISAHASDMSSWLFMAFPAAVYASGLIQVWTAVGIVLCMFLNWQFIAPRLRSATEKYKSLTLSTFFENKFDDKTGIFRIISAIICLAFFAVYLSSGLVAMGRLFHPIFGIDYTTGITFSMAVVIFYTIIGGFFAVSWNDVFQGLFLMFMIIMVPIVAFYQIDGIESIKFFAKLKNVSLNLLPQDPLFAIKSIFLITTHWGLGYFGQPHILTKFMGIRKVTEMKKAKIVGISWQILTLSAAIFVGIVGIAFFETGLPNNELIFALMVKNLFNPFFASFILCSVLAATISTMDSQIIVSAALLSEDFYKKTLNKKATPKQVLFVSRLGVVLMSLMAYFIALNYNQALWDLVHYAWTGLGCSFGPTLILTLYSKKINRYGAFLGMLIGALLAALLPFINKELPIMIIAFLSNLIITYLVSISTKKQNS